MDDKNLKTEMNATLRTYRTVKTSLDSVALLHHDLSIDISRARPSLSSVRDSPKKARGLEILARAFYSPPYQRARALSAENEKEHAPSYYAGTILAVRR